MKKWIKPVAACVIIIFLALAVYYSIPYVKLLYTQDGREVLNKKIQSFGAFAPLVFVGLEILQIVAAFIPGAPVEVLGGVLFGSFHGVIFCFAGVFIGTVLVFYLVKLFGQPLVNKIFPQEKLENIRILKDEKRLEFFIFILFLIPGTPKDFMTYIAALTKIKPHRFFFIATLSRTPSMICSVLMGSNIGNGRYFVSAIIFLSICLLSVGGYFVKNKFLIIKEKHNSGNE